MNIPIDFSLGFENWYNKDLQKWQEGISTKLLELVHYNNAPKGPFRIVETQVKELDGVRQKRHMVEPPPWPAQPIYEIEPLHADNNGVTLITFHGHGHDPFTGLYSYVRELSRRGYRVVMPILFGKMERETMKMVYNSERDAKAVCASWSIEADTFGMSILGIRLFDAMLAYRFAKTLPGVDTGRIGSIGLSMGGQFALYLPAIEPGIRCSVSAGFLASFKSALLDRRTFCQCYSICGWPQYFDMSDIAGCIAPRPLQIQKGLDDGCLDPVDTKEAFFRLKRIYEAFKAPERVQYVTYPGGHILNVDKAEEWFRIHVKHDN